MPGSIVSDQVVLNTCEAYPGTWLTIGSWGSGMAASNDIYLEGSYAINGRVSSAAPPTISLGWAHCTTPSGNYDLTGGKHIFMWIKCFSMPGMEKRVRGGIGISISSDATPTKTGTDPWSGATNSSQWFVTGSDYEPLSGWICYVIDPNSTPDCSIGSPAMNSADRIGIRAGAIATIGGGSVKPQPVLWDKLSFQSSLTITLGTAIAPVTMEDVYAADSLNANEYGICTKATGIYFLAGKLIFGTTGQSAVTVFTDTKQVYVWQDFPVAASFYELKLAGAPSFGTTVTLGSYSGGLASGGCIIRGTGLETRRLIAPVIVSGGTGYTANDILTVVGGTGSIASQFKVITVSGGVITEIRMERAGSYSLPPTGTLTVTGGTGSNATFTATVVGGSIWTLTADASNQTLNLYACTLSQMKSAALASTTTLRSCTFDDFGDITTNGATIDFCVFQNLRKTTPIGATYALNIATAGTATNCRFVNCGTAVYWNVNADTSSRLDGSEFISGGAGTGHGIELSSNCPSTLGLINVGFSAYGGTPGSNLVPASGSTDAAIYNNSGKEITINVSGGDTPSVRNGAGATTIVNSTVAVTVSPIVDGTEVRAYLTGTATYVDGTESSSGGGFTLSLPSGVAVDIVVLCYNPPMIPVRIQNMSFSVAQTLNPFQQTDRNFENP